MTYYITSYSLPGGTRIQDYFVLETQDSSCRSPRMRPFYLPTPKQLKFFYSPSIGYSTQNRRAIHLGFRSLQLSTCVPISAEVISWCNRYKTHTCGRRMFCACLQIRARIANRHWGLYVVKGATEWFLSKKLCSPLTSRRASKKVRIVREISARKIDF